MIKFQQSQALTSHFESFWSIVYRQKSIKTHFNYSYLGIPLPENNSGTDLKPGGSSLPDLTNFKIEPTPSANNFMYSSGGTCSTIKVENEDVGSPYSSVWHFTYFSRFSLFTNFFHFFL